MSNKNAGRPIESNPRNIAVRFKVTKEENERISTLCEQINKKKSELMRNLVLGNINEAEFFTYIGVIPFLQKFKKVNAVEEKKKEDLRTVVIMFKVTQEENERINTLTEKMNMKKSRLLRNIALSNLGDAEFIQNIGLLPLVKKVIEFKDRMKGI